MTLAPGSDAWQRLVTASKVPAILGVSPYDSPFSMWHQMKGTVEREPIDEALALRGHLLEEPILQWWLRKHQPGTRPKRQVCRWLDTWGIATLDMLARDESGDLAIVEAKTVGRGRDAWGEPGSPDIPVHVLAQVTWQLICTRNAERVYVVALFPGLDFEEFVVERDEVSDIMDETVERCRRFYRSLNNDRPPALDDHKATVTTLKALHPDIDRDTFAVIDDEWADAYVRAELALKAAEATSRLWKARLLDAAGRAQFIETETGRRVARRQSGKYGVSLVRVAKSPSTEEVAV